MAEVPSRMHARGALSSIPSVLRIGGIGKSELLGDLRARGVRLNDAAEQLFAEPRFTTSAEPHVIPIAAVLVVDLGLPSGGTYEQIIARAVESGLSECPLEAGPHLRLQYRSQPEAPSVRPSARGQAPSGAITVASAALDDREDTPKGFYLRSADGALWLRGYWSSRDHVWGPGDGFVLARTRGPIKPLQPASDQRRGAGG